MKTLLHLFMTLLLMLLLGCTPQTSSAPSPQQHLHDVDRSENTEHFVYIAEGLPKELKEEVKLQLRKLVVEQADEGDAIHIIRTPDHTTLGDFEIPHGKPRKRLRDAEVRAGLHAAYEMLDDDSRIPFKFFQQLNVPRIPETFWNIHQGCGRSRVILIGTPLYINDQFSQLSFTMGRYPNDASVLNPESVSPFANLLFNDLPEDCTVQWLLPKTNWGKGKTHRELVERFYRLAFQESLGGKLTRYTDDTTTAFQPTNHDGFPDIQIDPAQKLLLPQMLQVQDQDFMPDEVSWAIEQTSVETDRILIALNWESEKDSDLDIWLRDQQSSEELNFMSMHTRFGELKRDVRHAATNSSSLDVSEFHNWEMAIVFHDRLGDLVLWLNSYRCRSSVKAKVVLVFKGSKYVKEFDLGEFHGDEASDKDQRESSVSWRPIDLQEFAR